MFGSMFASKAIAGALAADPTIQAELGGRVVNGRRIPGDVPLPALMFYLEEGLYGGPVDAEGTLSVETCRYVVRVAVDGESHAPVLAAARAQLAALNGHKQTVTIDGATAHVEIYATAEYPVTSLVDEDVEYRQLGTIYTVEVINQEG